MLVLMQYSGKIWKTQLSHFHW